MHLPPLFEFPSNAEMATIDTADAIASVPAVFCGDVTKGQSVAPVGVSTHLWLARADLGGAALCGARPVGLYKRWRPVPGQQVDCARCLSRHAEVLRTR